MKLRLAIGCAMLLLVFGHGQSGRAQTGKVDSQRPTDEAPPTAGALLDIGAFRYCRKIPDGRPGLTALRLDAEVLSRSSVSDLRIADTDNRQIPYLIDEQEEPLTIELPGPERTAAPASRAAGSRHDSDAASFYLLRLPCANLPDATLVFTTSARVFRREIWILLEKNPRNERQAPWTYQIAWAPWRHTDAQTPAPPLELRLPSLPSTEALLMVEEGDNSPLPLASASLRLPCYRLRFFRPAGADLVLYYGNSSLAAPRYDLDLLASDLNGAETEEIQLDPRSASVSAQPAKHAMQAIVFWIVLGLAVLVLVALIVRLVIKSAT